MMIYVFDIDGTLSLPGDRIRHLKEEPTNWDDFYKRCKEDEPNNAICNLCSSLISSVNSKIVFLTGRRESCRSDTIEWLKRQGLLPRSFSYTLLMRPDGDIRHDTEVKPELLEKNIPRHISKSRIVIFEDRNSMVKKWRELGYTCCQVAEGDF